MADKQNLSGSPVGEPLYLSVGYLRRPHGLQGEIIMDLHTDFPERMQVGRKLFVGEEYMHISLPMTWGGGHACTEGGLSVVNNLHRCRDFKTWLPAALS